MATQKKQSFNALHTPEILNETFGGMTKSVGKALATEGGELGKGFLKQLLGIDAVGGKSSHAEQAPQAHDKNIIFHADKHHGRADKHKIATEKYGEKMQKKEHRAAAMDYHKDIVQNRERFSKRDVGEINQRLEQIMFELKKLVQTSKILQTEFAEVTVEQRTPNVGEYHLGYFEFLLEIVQEARKKVESSGMWLNTVKGKNGKKGGYWDQAQGGKNNHFTQSMDRNVSTQTG